MSLPPSLPLEMRLQRRQGRELAELGSLHGRVTRCVVDADSLVEERERARFLPCVLVVLL